MLNRLRQSRRAGSLRKYGVENIWQGFRTVFETFSTLNSEEWGLIIAMIILSIVAAILFNFCMWLLFEKIF